MSLTKPNIKCCVDCGNTETKTVRLSVCSTILNPKGKNFILCSDCLAPDKLNLDITVLPEPEPKHKHKHKPK